MKLSEALYEVLQILTEGTVTAKGLKYFPLKCNLLLKYIV
jgi:hypothetical protein